MSTSGQPFAKFPLRAIAGGRADTPPEELECTRPDAMFLRAQVMAIVRHFFEISCPIPSFEDQVVFVHEVERALERLNRQDTEVISW